MWQRVRAHWRDILLAGLVTIAFVAIVAVAAAKPIDLGAYAGAVAGIGTLALAFLTLATVRSQEDSLSELRAQRQPRLEPFIERRQPGGPFVGSFVIVVDIQNVGGAGAKDVRVDVLGDVPWLPLTPERPGRTVLEVPFLGAGGRVTLVELSVNQIGQGGRDYYHAVDVRIHWWSETGHQQLEARLDPGPYAFPAYR